MAEQNDQPSQNNNGASAQQDLDDLTVLANVDGHTLGDARLNAVRTADVSDTQLGNLANVQQGSTGSPQVQNLGGIAGGARVGLDIAIDSTKDANVAPPALDSTPDSVDLGATFVQTETNHSTRLNVQEFADLARPDTEFRPQEQVVPTPAVSAAHSGAIAANTVPAAAPAEQAAHKAEEPQAAINHAPTLHSSEVSTVNDDDAVTGKVGGLDLDGDTLTYSLVDANGNKVTSLATDHGTVTIDPATGEYTFTPNDAADVIADGKSAHDSFTVSASDGHGGTATTTIGVDITGSNDGPEVSGPVSVGGGDEDTSITIKASDLLSHATDIDGDTLSVSGLSATNGTITDNHDGTYTFTPNADFHGNVDLTYTVSDGHGGTAPGTATFEVASVNDAPTTSDVTLTAGPEDKSVIIKASDLLSHASDVDGDTLSVSDLHATNGTIADNHDGTFTFTPNADFHGNVDLTYTVSDGHGSSTAGAATFEVTPVTNDTGSGSTGTGETGSGDTGSGDTGSGGTGTGETGSGGTGTGDTGSGGTDTGDTGSGGTGTGDTGSGGSGTGDTGSDDSDGGKDHDGGKEHQHADNGVGNGSDNATPGHSTSNDENGATRGNPEHAHGGQDSLTLSTAAHVHVVADPAATVTGMIGADTIHTTTVTTVTGGNGSDFGNDSGTLVIHATADSGGGGDKHGFDIVYDGQVVGHASAGTTTLSGLDIHDGGKLSLVGSNGTNVTVDSITLNGTAIDVGTGVKSGGVQVDGTHHTADLHNGSVTYSINDGNAGQETHTTTTATHTQTLHLDVGGQESQLGGLHVTGLHAGDTVSDGSHVWTAGGDGAITITETQLDQMSSGDAVHHDFTVISGQGAVGNVEVAGLDHDGGAYTPPSHLEANLDIAATGAEHNLTYHVEGIPAGCSLVSDGGTLHPGADGSFTLSSSDVSNLKVIIPGDGSVSDFNLTVSATDADGSHVATASQSLAVGVDEALGSQSHSFDSSGVNLAGTSHEGGFEQTAMEHDSGDTMLFDFGSGHDTIQGGGTWTDVAHAADQGDHGAGHGAEHGDWTEKADKHAETDGKHGDAQEHKDDTPVHHQVTDDHQNHFQSHDHSPM